MRMRTFVMLWMMLSMASVPGHAQHGHTFRRRVEPADTMGMGNPVALLLDRRLDLTATQTARIAELAAALARANSPLRDRVEAALASRGGAGVEEARSMMPRLRANNRRALDRALAVLTPEQRARALDPAPRLRLAW